MEQLPLSGRVIFSDWHGVLSRDPFWVSIQQSPRHPLRAQLQAGMAGVFSKDKDTAEEWMKGLRSSSQVIQEMGIQLHGRSRDDFLARRLDLDCRRMKVNVELFDVLRALRAETTVVIATDNMDCFVRAFEQARNRRRRRGEYRETMADWAAICDDIISSSEIGALKEDPQAFFGPWLERHGMTFRDSVLVDDRADNCAAFTSQGGEAIQWKLGTHDIGEVVGALRSWIDARADPAGLARASAMPGPGRDTVR